MELKVLVISSYDDNYNAVRPEGEIFIALQKQGVQVEVMTQGHTAYAKRFKDQGIKVYDHHPTKKMDSASIHLIRNILKEGKHHIMHLFNSKAIVNGIRAAWDLPVKVVTYRGFAGHIHWYDPSSYLTHLNPRVDKIMCVSDSIRAQLSAQWTLPKHKLVVIPKRHQVSWYEEVKPLDVREAFDLSSKAFVLTCVANARKFKGIPYLLKAFDEMPTGLPIFLILVGRGMDHKEHIQIINQSPYVDQIRFAGFRKDVLSFIAGSDALILPSTGKEGLPKVLIEAMCLKTACIATDILANKSIVRHEKTALQIPIKDPTAIAKAILRYYQNPGFKEKIAQQAYAFMENEFTLDQTVKELKSVYLDLIK